MSISTLNMTGTPYFPIFPGFVSATGLRLSIYCQSACLRSRHSRHSRPLSTANLRTSAFSGQVRRAAPHLPSTHRHALITSSAPSSDPPLPSSDNPSEDADDQARDVVLGPAQAPTQAGVSTVGLSEQDASFISACYDADIAGIEKALSDGQDVNITDVNRRTALHFCAANGLPTLCRRLLELGAQIDGQDVTGLTALHMATGYRKLDTVKLLLEEGADANLTSVKGELAVEIAEGILEKTPRKKWFGENQMWRRMKEIVDVLDEATELEDEDADGDNDDENGTVEEITEETEKAKFVVRVKQRGEKTVKQVAVPDDAEVKVTVRVKTPEP